MAKLVCHAEKYKKGNVSSIERHNERKIQITEMKKLSR